MENLMFILFVLLLLSLIARKLLTEKNPFTILAYSTNSIDHGSPSSYNRNLGRTIKEAGKNKEEPVSPKPDEEDQLNDLTQALLERITRENLSIPEVLDIIENRGGIKYEKMKACGEIDLVVDYRQRFNQMIAAGNYDYVGDDFLLGSGDINESNFPLPSELIGKIMRVQVKLFHFSIAMNPKEAAVVMEKTGYRPGLLPELLTLGESLPDLQRHFVVIASGSSWYTPGNGWHYIPCLTISNYKRVLRLNSREHGWLAGCRFMGVKIISEISTNRETPCC